MIDKEVDQFQEEEDEAEQFKIKRVVADSQDDSLDLSQHYVQQSTRKTRKYKPRE